MTVLSGPRLRRRSRSAASAARPAAAGGFVTGMLRVSWLAELQAQMLHYPQEPMHVRSDCRCLNSLVEGPVI